MNRVESAIGHMKNQIRSRVAQGLTTLEKVEATRKSLDMDVEEFVKFQELKSLAVANSKLSLDEGLTIYQHLGETPEHFNRQSVEVKVILTQIFSELLKARIRETI